MSRGRELDRLPLLTHSDTSSGADLSGSRNRLSDLLGSDHDRDEENPPAPTQQDEEMTKYLSWTADIKDRLAAFSHNIKKIEEKQSEILTSTQAHRAGEPSELDVLIDETQEIAQNIRNQLKKMEVEIKEREKTGNMGYASNRIRTNMHATLTKKFIDLMTSYQKTQENFKKGYKERIARQYKNANPKASEEEVRAAVDGNADPSSIFLSSQLSLSAAVARNALADITEKHREIKKLEQSMVELHQLFMDMAVMVEAQGELLNNIEHNVSQTVEYVQSANEQLEQAKKLQKSARKKMCCIVICLVCLLGFLASFATAAFKFWF